MSVVALSELCRQELRYLLETRFMRGGWSREGDRKVSLKFHEVSTEVEAQLVAVKDLLLVRPSAASMKVLLARAAGERTLKAMAERFVRELSALPVPDQEDAYAVTELHEKGIHLNRVLAALETAKSELTEKVGSAGIRGVDFDDLFAQLDTVIYQTTQEQDRVRRIVAEYERQL